MQPSSEPHAALGRGLTESEIRDQLQKILAADIFLRSERLRSFLRLIVEETLAGRGDVLKEQVIASALYAARTESSTSDDSVVRSDARRLRDKLREYYAEADRDPVLISLPKGTYTPEFEKRAAIVSDPRSPSERDHPPVFESHPAKAWRFWLGLAVLAAVLGIAIVWWRARPGPRPQIVALTQYPGGEGMPSFSPDGNFIAFQHWEPPGPTAQDIWIKAVDGETRRPLTGTPPPVAEHSPAWSPDGKEIAFARSGWARPNIPNQGVFTISTVGGPERKISDSGRFPKWTPDGRSVLIRDGSPGAIFQIDLATLTRREIVRAPLGDDVGKFDISPDGETIAFILSKRSGASDIFLVPLTGGEFRQLTNWGAYIDGLTWTPDGRDIIYGVTGQSLWRIPTQLRHPGPGTPVPGLESLVIAGANAGSPSISHSRGRPARLAFQVVKVDISLRLIQLEPPLAGNFLRVKPLLDSTRIDIPGPFSPDGERIAYNSYLASFPAQLWVAKRDGSDVRQITPIKAPRLRAGSWSPDGGRLAFEAAVGGVSGIYTVAADGGHPSRLISDSATNVSPSWSHDGRWIYYSSNRSGRYEVWKVSSEGGVPRQITRTGGIEPTESPDGKHVFHLDPIALEYENTVAFTAKLKIVPIDGGEEKVVLGAVRQGLWGVTQRGIFFLTAEPDFEAIDLCQLPEGKVTRIGRLPFVVPRRYPRLTFSRDGRWALANEVDRRESDLMMIENFR